MNTYLIKFQDRNGKIKGIKVNAPGLIPAVEEAVRKRLSRSKDLSWMGAEIISAEKISA